MGSASWRPAPSSAAATATMRRNRPVDTGPEVRLRAALHAKGLRFRKSLLIRLPHGRTRPDIVFSRRRVVVYVDGCFWHSCPHHGSVPAANADYWIPKLQRTNERDRLNDEALRAAGWIVVRIWEHEALDEAVAVIQAAVTAKDEQIALAATSRSVKGNRHRSSEPCSAIYSNETEEGAQKPSASVVLAPCSPWKDRY
jgi:DNA mismatch endonuclease, patch repair protein